MPDYEGLMYAIYMGVAHEGKTVSQALQGTLLSEADCELDTVILACASLAGMFGDHLSGEYRPSSANELWRLAAILACDAGQIRRYGILRPTAQDALAYWKITGDQIFLAH